jgi:basic amino acid/polyamine antiporter, APA family
VSSESAISATPNQPVTYARRLGVWDASMIVVGGVIGSGIFRNPGSVAARTSSGEMTIVAWLVGAALALIGALCYAELGTRRPQAGGAYVYLRESSGTMVAFLYGWTMLVVNYSASAAAVATVFATYLCAAIGLSQPTTQHLVLPLAIGSIILLTGISYFGIKAGALVQNVLTVLKLLAIAGVVVAGLFIATPNAPVIAKTAAPALTVWNFGTILMPVLFSYGGWAYINNIAGEIREPKRNMPRALILGMALVAACYLLANFAYLRMLGHAGLAASTAPAADVMRAAFGESGARIIALGIAISTFGFCNISIIAAARVFQVMAADGLFFGPVAHLHPRYRTPDVALFAVSGWAIVLALTGSFEELLNYSTTGDWLGYAGAVATLYYYRRHVADPNAFHAPGYPWLPGIFIVAVLAVVLSNVVASPRDAGMGLLITLAGLPVYWFWSKRRASVG